MKGFLYAIYRSPESDFQPAATFFIKWHSEEGEPEEIIAKLNEYFPQYELEPQAELAKFKPGILVYGYRYGREFSSKKDFELIFIPTGKEAEVLDRYREISPLSILFPDTILELSDIAEAEVAWRHLR